MRLLADDIETMRIALRAYWTNAGHSAEAPEALCDLALKGLRAEVGAHGDNIAATIGGLMGKLPTNDPYFRAPDVPLTLRDKMAAACLPAIYASMTQLTDRAAELAYEQADEMIRARDAAHDESSPKSNKGD